jgi:hypothetical protein
MADKKQQKAVLTTPVFRVSFPQLFEAKAYGTGEAKFSVQAIFDKKLEGAEREKMEAMVRLAEATAIEKFGEENFRKLRKLGKFKWPFRDGEEKEFDGYGPDKVFMTLSTKNPPGVIGRNKERVTVKDVYAGCYARATVGCYSFDNESKGVAFGLNNVQKVGEGPGFSQRTAAEEDFTAADDSVWVDDYVAPVADGPGDAPGKDPLDDMLG